MKKLLALGVFSALLVAAVLVVQGRAAKACCPTPPPNDNFNKATVVNSLPFDDKVDSSSATIGGNDPSTFCKQSHLYGFSVWYQYTPTSDQKVGMNTNLSGVSDTVLAVFSGNKGALTEVACDDDSGTGFHSALTVALNAGTTYHILVASWTTNTGGNLRLQISLVPANDHSNHATVIISLPFDDEVDSTYATTDNNDPGIGSCSQGHSHAVWYRYTPPSTRTVDVNTNGSGIDDTILAVFTGNKGALTMEACNDDISYPSDRHSAIKLALTGGTTYYVLAGSFFNTAGGNLQIHITSQGDEQTIEPPFATSNFKCYQAKIAKRSVHFVQQAIFTFDPNLRIRAQTTVTGLSLYCNPAKQVLLKQTGGTGGFDDPAVPFKDFRETCYAARDDLLAPSLPATGRHVFAENKFGDLKLTLGRLESICVLALKTGGQLPDYGDLQGQILKCYSARPVTGSPRFQPVPVGLSDQFDGNKTATVLRPVSYCMFAGKSNEPQCIIFDCKCFPTCGGGAGLQPPLPFRAAVVCYSIRQAGFRPFNIPVIDQFLDQQFVDPLVTIKRADRLCVPSIKKPPFADNDDIGNAVTVHVEQEDPCVTADGIGQTAASLYICSFSDHVVTMNATRAHNDPPLVHCASVTDHVDYGHSVWYTYTPTRTEDAHIDVDTEESSYDTVLVLYTGSKGSLTQLACNDDDGSLKTSKLEADLQVGHKYFIMVGSKDRTPGGKLKFSLDACDTSC